ITGAPNSSSRRQAAGSQRTDVCARLRQPRPGVRLLRQGRLRPFVIMLAVILTSGCVVGPVPSGESINLKEARKVSDSFMTDLVNDRVDLALDIMEPEFVKAMGRPEAEAGIRKRF